mmetsp:Transcript_15495/g.29423  ORF Transcript_15495/g.29423 Transcript_15495/m.29423 type:complete len:95 (+) Transcript_15495:100-384(+)
MDKEYHDHLKKIKENLAALRKCQKLAFTHQFEQLKRFAHTDDEEEAGKQKHDKRSYNNIHTHFQNQDHEVKRLSNELKNLTEKMRKNVKRLEKL